MDVQLFFLRCRVNTELEQIRDYIDENEKYIRDSLQNLQQKENETRKKCTEKKLIEYYNSKEYYRLTKSFPNLLRKSVIVTLYSMLDSILNSICDYEKGLHNLDSYLNTKRYGQSIYRAENYLYSKCFFDISKYSNWNEMKIYNEIRNLIIHKDCIIEIEEYKIDTLLNKSRLIELINEKRYSKKKGGKMVSGMMLFNVGILDDFFDTISNFLANILTTLENQ